MNKGFDANRDLTQFGTCLINEGIHFVGRYYNKNNSGKNLTCAEATHLSSIGLSIVAIWENGFPTCSSYFSYQKGLSDGEAAYNYASNTINQPTLTPIYFAVDYDASLADITKPIDEYFQGIYESFNQIGKGNPRYLIGVYGSGMVCKSLLKKNKVTHSWLAQSSGWRGYKSFTNYNIKQLKERSEAEASDSIAGDLNESPNNNEGSFRICT
jgi:hypothetical protein